MNAHLIISSKYYSCFIRLKAKELSFIILEYTIYKFQIN